MELLHKDLTEKIIGASFEVHKFLGNGFQEVIYQRALSWEFTQVKLNFQREIEQEIFYKQLRDPIGKRRADFVIDRKVLVEIKAVINLEDVHLAQVLNYLKAYQLKVGLLINFGNRSLQFKLCKFQLKSIPWFQSKRVPNFEINIYCFTTIYVTSKNDNYGTKTTNHH